MGLHWVRSAAFVGLLLFIPACSGSGGSGIILPDTTPPGAVVDLAVLACTSTTVTLTWTAAGDDGLTGSGSTYDIRYDAVPITPVSWGGATPVAGLPVPQPGGSSEQYQVTGLDPSTDYYFALTSSDEVPNVSPLSNGVMVTTKKGWRGAEFVETEDLGDVWLARVASDATGAVTVVWSQDDGVVDNAWSRRFLPGTGWDPPLLLESDNSTNAYPTGVAANASGVVVAVWYRSGGGENDILSVRYVPGSGWGAVEPVNVDAGDTDVDADVDIAPSGEALSTWLEYGPGPQIIRASVYTVGVGWGASVRLDIDGVGHARSPKVVMDDSGNGLAVWTQGGSYVFANRYTSGVGWGTATQIGGGGALGVDDEISVAMSDGGDAVAVWGQYDTGLEEVWSCRFTPVGGWEAPLQLDNDLGTNWPEVAMNAAGNAGAVWDQVDGTQASVWVNRYAPGTGWSGPEVAENDDSGDVNVSKIAVSEAGHLFVAWRLSVGGRRDAWASRYELGTGWASPELLETEDLGSVFFSGVVARPSDCAIVVWRQWNGVRYNLWANRFE